MDVYSSAEISKFNVSKQKHRFNFYQEQGHKTICTWINKIPPPMVRVHKKKNYFNKLDLKIKHIGGKKEALSGR